MSDTLLRFQPESRHSLGQLVPPRLQFFHVEDMSREQFAQLLAANGFAGVENVDVAVESLRAADLIAGFPSPPRDGLSVMVDFEDETTVLFRPCDPTWLRGESTSIDIIEFYRPAAALVRSKVLAAVPDAIYGPTWHYDERQSLTKRLTGLSTNGRLLTMPTVQNACRDCYDDTLRQNARANAPLDDRRQRALKQGLWLEHLVADICLQFTPDVWAGQMADLFELDVVAMIDGQTLLFECKDSSFGQNDFLVALKKAHDVEASTLLLLSTRPFHPNVIRAINKEIDRAYDEGDSCVIPVLWLSAADTCDIASSLNDFINDLRQRTMFHWLDRHFTSAASPDFFDSDGDSPEA